MSRAPPENRDHEREISLVCARSQFFLGGHSNCEPLEEQRLGISASYIITVRAIGQSARALHLHGRLIDFMGSLTCHYK